MGIAKEDHNIVIIGEPGVGKTSLVRRLVGEEFNECEKRTLRYDFKKTSLTDGNKKLTLRICEVHGGYRSLSNPMEIWGFFLGIDGVIIVYDVTNRSTYAQLSSWYACLPKITNRKDVAIMLVGNKIDSAVREVNGEEGLEFARKHRMLFIEASAKTNEGVKTALEELMGMIRRTPVAAESIVKLLIIGDSSVGKTSLLRAYMNKKFDDKEPTTTTAGINLEVCTDVVRGKRVQLEICDTSGSKKDFESLVLKRIPNAQGVILVYDVTNRSTYGQLKCWHDDVPKITSRKDVTIMLVGNKIDSEDRKVKNEEGVNFAHINQMMYLEASAKTNQGVETIFEELVKAILWPVRTVGADCADCAD